MYSWHTFVLIFFVCLVYVVYTWIFSNCCKSPKLPTSGPRYVVWVYFYFIYFKRVRCFHPAALTFGLWADTVPTGMHGLRVLSPFAVSQTCQGVFSCPLPLLRQFFTPRHLFVHHCQSKYHSFFETMGK